MKQMYNMGEDREFVESYKTWNMQYHLASDVFS